MSGTVSASMNCLSLQTPSKKFRRNRDEDQASNYFSLSSIKLSLKFIFLIDCDHTVTTSRICLVGAVKKVPDIELVSQVNFIQFRFFDLLLTAFVFVFQSLGLVVVYSEDGLEYVNPQLDTVFVLYEFSGEEYETLYQRESRILGYPALLEIANKKCPIPDLDRPLFSISMENVVTCFTGFRNREEVVSSDFPPYNPQSMINDLISDFH